MKPSETDWISIAERASALLAAPAPRGKKQAHETEVAASFGLARSTLEAYLVAFKFLGRLRQLDPYLADRLKQARAPAISVKAIAQWAKIDEPAALHFIYSHGRYDARETLRAVATARRTARHDPTPTAAPGIVEAFWQWTGATSRCRSRDSFRHEIRQHVATLGWHDDFGFAELDWKDCDDPYAVGLGVSQVGYVSEESSPLHFLNMRQPPTGDRWRRRGDHRAALVSSITIGPRQLLESFGREAKVAWNRWVVAATLYPITIVTLPDEAALEKTVAHLPPPPMMADWPTSWPIELRAPQLRDLSNSASRLYVPAPALGCLIVTCLPRFFDDCLER
jgi:hypothetical protein